MIPLSFMQWWQQHAPKGCSNSINALVIVGHLLQSREPLSFADLSSRMGRKSIHSLRCLVYAMMQDGHLIEEERHAETQNRHRYLVYTLSPSIIARLKGASS